MSHIIDSTLNRGRELCVRCLCGWESHWWPSYTSAKQQFEIHEELHAHD